MCRFKGVLIKRAIAICLNKLNNLESVDDDSLHRIKSTQFQMLVEKFAFDDKYLSIYQRFIQGVQPPGDAGGLGYNQIVAHTDIDHLKTLPIDDVWFVNQVKYHTSSTSATTIKMECRVELLNEIKTESKLIGLIESTDFNKSILSTIIKVSFENIVNNFKTDCVQYNSHINYLKIPIILKITLYTLYKYVEEFVNRFAETVCVDEFFMTDYFLLNFEVIKKSVVNLLASLDWLEENCLIFIEAKLIEKYIKENFMRPIFHELLLQFMTICFYYVQKNSAGVATTTKTPTTPTSKNQSKLHNTLVCIDAILKQKFIWTELNMNDEKYEDQLILAVNTIYDYLRNILRTTNFWRKFKSPEPFRTIFKDNKNLSIYLKTIFIAKYMEEKDNIVVVASSFSSKTQVFYFFFTIHSIFVSNFDFYFLCIFVV